MHGLEISFQDIPRTTQQAVKEAGSLPLHDLADVAPKLDDVVDMSRVRFSFSNDEAASYYDQAQARVLTPEYQEASNRTAVIVGEGALMAALPYIPEETIVLIDMSRPMASFMSRYVDALRSSDTFEEWMKKMNLDRVNLGSVEYRVVRRLGEQMGEWKNEGYLHPARDEDTYTTAHELANEKAIIAWNGDIARYRDMRELGDALKARDANITMLNLTNVLPYCVLFRRSAPFVKRLDLLPVTPNAPILTTGLDIKPSPDPAHDSFIVQATGPFFGLQNLRDHGGKTAGRRQGSAAKRQYLPTVSVEPSPRPAHAPLREVLPQE